LQAVSFKKPVSSANLTIEVHRAASTLQAFFQIIDLGLYLELVLLGEVTQVSG
jgi:hypothetical protein